MADNIAGQAVVTSVDQMGEQNAFGKITFDATVIVTTDTIRIQCGFKPRYIKVLNQTSRIQGEWYEGMTTAERLHTVAVGTRTLDTTAGGIVPDIQGFRILQNATLGYVTASSVLYWEAQG